MEKEKIKTLAKKSEDDAFKKYQDLKLASI